MWVGWAWRRRSRTLCRMAAIVAGINARQYLSAFSDGAEHLHVDQVPPDYMMFADALRSRNLLVRPVILSGVSEGAALAVATAASPATHQWVDAILTMGLPPTAELGWRLKDIVSWITTKDADEPFFSPHAIIAQVSPLPLWMIHSTRDEYVAEADYRRFDSVARDHKNTHRARRRRTSTPTATRRLATTVPRPTDRPNQPRAGPMPAHV